MTPLKTKGLIFALGGLGGLCRYGMGRLFPDLISLLATNLLGTFFLMFFVRGLLSKKASPSLLLGLGTGFAGGFTSFSSLMLDLTKLGATGQYGGAGAYLLAHVLGGLLVAHLARIWAERLGWL